jgi:hypothetical protein
MRKNSEGLQFVVDVSPCVEGFDNPSFGIVNCFGAEVEGPVVEVDGRSPSDGNHSRERENNWAWENYLACLNPLASMSAIHTLKHG